MQKRTLLLSAAVIILLLLNSCGALFMGDEEKEFLGLWSSTGWDGDGTCYYDFEDNGNVFVTDYTKTWRFYNYLGLPVHFNYSVSSDTLRMSQYLGLAKYEFEISSVTDTRIDLRVLSASGDYDQLDYGSSVTLYKVIDYSEQDRAAAALFEEMK